MQYRWTDTAYPTLTAMLDAIAEAWITANGHAAPQEIARTFAELTDDGLAAECIEGWGLAAGTGWNGEEPAHMERSDYTTADLAAAFARLRARTAATV